MIEPKMSNTSPDIILALDLEDREQINQVLQATGNRLKWVKVGLQSFLREGKSLVHELADSGKNVFLDLKLHDIPNTMEKALASLAELPVGMITLHAGAGPEALARCSKFAKENIPDVTLLGVTVLTSTNQQGLEAVGVKDLIEDQVLRLAKLAVDQGIGGIVCSPQELPRLRQALPLSTTLVTPGIRPVHADAGDQKRIMTPRQAKLAGANYLVIGRPILTAPDPEVALASILDELAD
ncbi:MAG: orotidine-5'-phosphate decarboxylase [Opitutae bacterium]